MPRRPRVFVEGAIYHVYARITRREGIFVEPREAEAWVAIVREVMQRDGLAVLAWSLMSNHFHLLVRTGAVPLWRSMRSIQGRFAVGFNRRHGLVGPVWQSRYKAKIVRDDSNLRQVVAYIHLNPVRSGVVKAPDEYSLSGHREVVGVTVASIADPDEVLRLFGDTRRTARRAYRNTVRAVLEQIRLGDAPSHFDGASGDAPDEPLPARPRPGLDALGASRAPCRPSFDAHAFLDRACSALDIDGEIIRSRRQGREVTRAREAIVLIGTERYGVRLNALAAAMGKSADAASRWVVRAASRRRIDVSFASLVGGLDAALSVPELRNEKE